VATRKWRDADEANNRLTADLAFPTFDFSYTLEVAAEPDGVKISVNLDKPPRCSDTGQFRRDPPCGPR
jgi:endoglucanase